MALPDSDDEILLLHTPRCSKSRATLALLEERGVRVEVRPYLEDPLSPAELEVLRGRLGRPVSEWVRRKESACTEAGLDASSGDSELIAAVARHPILMERPILVRGARAAIGRPPEDVLTIL